MRCCKYGLLLFFKSPFLNMFKSYPNIAGGQMGWLSLSYHHPILTLRLPLCLPKNS